LSLPAHSIVRKGWKPLWRVLLAPQVVATVMGFWFALMIASVWPLANRFPPLAILGSFIALFAIYVLFQIAYRIAGLLIGRRYKPVSIPDPPTLSEDEGLEYEIRPSAIYPALALGRLQPGWVWIEVKFKKNGRITAYRVLDQHPGKTFERAVANGLFSARVRHAKTISARTRQSLICFVPADKKSEPSA
jgi:hypothetical protein